MNFLLSHPLITLHVTAVLIDICLFLTLLRQSGLSALMRAVYYNSMDCVRLLLESGCALEFQDEVGDVSYSYASPSVLCYVMS